LIAGSEISVRYGYRTIRFDPDHGFVLNDQPLKLKGTCNHQDHAGVGVAVPDSIHEFRIRRLKEMGCNAIRCAHNPPAPELLDACDRLGMLVMDENRNFGSSPEHLAKLRSMVLRDRNHPASSSGRSAMRRRSRARRRRETSRGRCRPR
jgi:beta-galactosidase